MSSPENNERLSALLEMSHQLGMESRQLAMLGEGNTSTRLNEKTFLVKASGSNLETLKKEGVVECRFNDLLPLLQSSGMTDQQVDAALFACRVDVQARKPSVEALFHAYFLTLPGVEYVGHAHPIAANQILCSPRAREFAVKRLFPDEIVCCGEESVFVPYTDPGLVLAQAIRRETDQYLEKFGSAPRIVLLENHGVIALGKTPQAVLAAMLMAEKAARIWVGAAALGGPQFLTPAQVARIAGRPDEHYRQKALNL